MTHQVQMVQDSELSLPLMQAIASLTDRCFASERNADDRLREMQEMDRHDSETVTSRRFLIYEDDGLIAHARTFVREIILDGQLTPVLALASVCSMPECRGRGLGAAVTQAAFRQIGDDTWPNVSLFQTPVPKFYEKLNSRIVTNQFVNRRNEKDPEADPWSDDYAMIYPSEYDWPEGAVDLNGPGY